MTSQLPALCFSCRRLDRSVTDPDTGTVALARCQAFPDGIPVEIAWGGDHRQPVGGEVDLVYEQAPGAEAQRDFETWQKFHKAISGS